MKKKQSAPKIKNPLQKEIFALKRDWITRNMVKEKVDWPRCMKILGGMFELIPDLEFWKVFQLWQRFDNLYWFLKESGKATLLKEYDKWIKNKTSKAVSKNEETGYILEPTKIGPDIKQIESVTKPKSLKDFLDGK